MSHLSGDMVEQIDRKSEVMYSAVRFHLEAFKLEFRAQLRQINLQWSISE